MFKYLIPLFLCLFTFPGTRVLAQHEVPLSKMETPVPTVANSMHSLQTDLNGLLYVNERRLSDKVALRLEAGLTQSIRYFSDNSSLNHYALRPVLIVEPRYYYNFARRAEAGKVTDSNSGNFVGAALQYRPNFFAYSSNERYSADHVTSFIPYWGLRRQLGRHWDFEFTAGLRMDITGSIAIARTSVLFNRSLDLGVRFGYRF